MTTTFGNLPDPLLADEIVVVHADLPEVDWPGTLEHIEATAAGFKLVVANGSKTFFQMVEHPDRRSE